MLGHGSQGNLTGQRAINGDDLAHLGQKDKLQPLLKCHRLAGKGRRVRHRLGRRRLVLPQLQSFQFGFDKPELFFGIERHTFLNDIFRRGA